MKKYFLSAIVVATFAIGFTASDEVYKDETGQKVDTTGIPSDDLAQPNPEVITPTTNIPNIQTSVSNEDGTIVMRIDMTGVKNSTDLDWLKLYGTGLSNQNVWVEIDGKPKGIDVINLGEQTERTVMTDIVFTVDNSGSMDDEANKIANDIIAWAQLLANSNIDARFGVVGYEGPITGALNMTTVDKLSEYLNYSYGTNRTYHFGGPDAADLQAKAPNYHVGTWAECGACAIEYANEYFNFRTGANRIYINFTDEPNQPYGKEKYSVKFFESQTNWAPAQGTVHSIYSSSQFDYNNWNYNEQPWLISEYTGGTTQFIRWDASDLDLTKILVTQAMQNSYIIRLKDVGDLINDGIEHEIHVTILSEEGENQVRAEKTFMVRFDM
jgi:hypothetical protein